MVAERLVAAVMLVALAEICGRNGRVAEGFDLVAEELKTAERTGLRMPVSELHRLKGELLLIRDAANVVEAERCLRTAIEVALRQSARLFELRATVSLARLMANQGRRDEARAMLTDIYSWFTEGFEIPDLKEAKALLGQLGTYNRCNNSRGTQPQIDAVCASISIVAQLWRNIGTPKGSQLCSAAEIASELEAFYKGYVDAVNREDIDALTELFAFSLGLGQRRWRTRRLQQ